MTIKVYSDRIEIGAKTITTTPTGIRIDDSLAANTQAQGYVRQANFTARELAFGNFVFQGSVAGFQTNHATPGVGFSNIIQKFPFTSDTNASDVGDTTVTKRELAGQSSTVSGYSSGGIIPGNSRINTIDKFPFATNGNATDVGDLTSVRLGASGQSSSVSGYSSGGDVPAASNIIDKFPFATDSNAMDVGDITTAKNGGAGQSSTVNGYMSGGSPGFVNTINKFPFSADTNATDIGDLTQGRAYGSGQSSTVSGYTSGGYPAALPATNNTNTIDKFPFATDSNATDVGDLTVSRYATAGQSSTTHGYTSGGYVYNPPAPTHYNTIEKFSFSTDTNAGDVGDLVNQGAASGGQQF